jgi:hypothetical protein
MSESHPETTTARRRGRHAPAIVALFLLGFMGLFWFLVIGGTAALFYTFGWREGVLVGGGFLILTAIFAEFRISGFETVFDWIYEIGAFVLGLVGAIVSGILGLFGLSWND